MARPAQSFEPLPPRCAHGFQRAYCPFCTPRTPVTPPVEWLQFVLSAFAAAGVLIFGFGLGLGWW